MILSVCQTAPYGVWVFHMCNTLRKNTGRGPCTPLSSRQHYFLNPQEKGLLYCRVQALLARQRFFATVHTVIRFVWVNAKFGICTVVSINGTFVEDEMRRFEGEYALFIFNKCPIYIHDGASAKFSTNSHEIDNSAGLKTSLVCLYRMYSVLVILPRLNRTQAETWLPRWAPSPRKVYPLKIINPCKRMPGSCTVSARVLLSWVQ
jgi:hypothetical protein